MVEMCTGGSYVKVNQTKLVQFILIVVVYWS